MVLVDAVVVVLVLLLVVVVVVVVVGETVLGGRLRTGHKWW